MDFINPIEILHLQDASIVSIDDNVIKRAKKKLFVEIEFSDNSYNYHGYKLTKSDCERVIDELYDKNRKEYYYQLATALQPLNDYLVNNEEVFFLHFRHESIYMLPDFVGFINPTFAQNFDRSLLKAFKNRDNGLIASILRAKILIDPNNINTAFKSLGIELQSRINEIDKITDEIKTEKNHYTTWLKGEVLDIVKNKFPVTLLNLLPEYFQSQINKIASSLNLLALAIDKYFNNTQIPEDLLLHLLQLNINSVGKQTFENNFRIFKEINDEKAEQEKNAPVREKWADVLLQIKTAIKRVDEKTLPANTAGAKVVASVNISELNSLPPFANEIRNQIGYAIRSLSISAWNAQKDITTALKLINQALNINVSQDAKQKFEADLKDLKEIKNKLQGQRLAVLQEKNTSSQNKKKSWEVLLIAGIILLIIYVSSSVNSSEHSSSTSHISSSNNSYTPSTKDNSTYNPTDTSSSYPVQSSNNSTENTNNIETSNAGYKMVNMENGNITDCSNLRPRYDYSIKNKLIITAWNTDAAVKIINYRSNKCIRFVFINKGTTYTVRNIPEGKYYLKIAYGDNWEIKDGDPLCKGRFAYNALYKKDGDVYDFNKVHYDDGRVSIPYFTLRLFTRYSSNKYENLNQTNTISENEFLNDN